MVKESNEEGKQPIGFTGETRAEYQSEHYLEADINKVYANFITATRKIEAGLNLKDKEKATFPEWDSAIDVVVSARQKFDLMQQVLKNLIPYLKIIEKNEDAVEQLKIIKACSGEMKDLKFHARKFVENETKKIEESNNERVSANPVETTTASATTATVTPSEPAIVTAHEIVGCTKAELDNKLQMASLETLQDARDIVDRNKKIEDMYPKKETTSVKVEPSSPIKRGFFGSKKPQTIVPAIVFENTLPINKMTLTDRLSLIDIQIMIKGNDNDLLKFSADRLKEVAVKAYKEDLMTIQQKLLNMNSNDNKANKDIEEKLAIIGKVIESRPPRPLPRDSEEHKAYRR